MPRPVHRQIVKQYVSICVDGYVPEETSLKSTLNVFTTYNTMNLSVGGLTDLSSGGFWTYGTNRMLVILDKIRTTPAERKRTDIMKFAYANYTEIQGEAFRNDTPERRDDGRVLDIAGTENIAALSEMTGLSKQFIAKEALKDNHPDEFTEIILKAYDKKISETPLNKAPVKKANPVKK